jgi:enoyl-CoA hydratase/3-hydroxyacyl-CoA dehydrogenase
MNTFVESLYKRGVAVVGAGNMGAGIAQKIAQEGIPVYLLDRSGELAQAGKERIAAVLSEAVARKIFSTEDTERVLSLVKASADLAAAAQAALVIEAVFEDHSVKSAIFKELDEICAPDTIFATNTSSLSVQALAAECGRPDRFGGLHFFYHPAKNKLLEVIAGKSTSAATENALWDFARAIKKVSIRTSDSAGFAVNRFFVAWLNEAVRILEEGESSIAEIETVAKETFKIGMGPFELMNVTGVPIAFHAAESLSKSFGSFYEPSALLRQKAEKGTLWNLDSADCRFSKAEQREASRQEIAERLLGCVFYIAASLVEEGVATKEDTDRGATVGLRWNEGPFQMMNSLSTGNALRMVENFSKRYKDLSVPESLSQHGQSNRPFELSYVELTVKDWTARITINRPEAMNALNPGITRQLKEKFLQAEQNADVKAIVFEGIGKAFVAGADIRFFIDALDADNFPRIYEFTKEGQDLFKSISASKKLTIAFVNGIAYGGGAELALACQKIVVGAKAQFAFPETGIGIYPGLGGTQRLPRKIGKELARYLIFTGSILNAEDALSVGLADGALSDGRLVLLDEAGRARACVDLPVLAAEKRSALPVWAEAAKVLFSDLHVEDALAGESSSDITPALKAVAQKALKSLSFKAPIALKMAHKLINCSSCPSIDEGLALELASLKEIFSSEDAYEGLSSLGKRRPVYRGR